MTPTPSFNTDALAQIERGILHIIASANLQVRTAPLPRSLVGRLRGQLRGLETLLRRVLMLMALAILPGLAPGTPKRAKTIKSQRSTRPLQRPMRLLPAPLVLAGAHGFPDMPRATGPVSVRKLFCQIAALQTVLAAPEAHAKRLARQLRRLMAAGEARPVVLPQPRPKRVGRELVLVSDILPVHLRAALAAWPDTS